MGGQSWMWGCVIVTSEAQMRGRSTGRSPIPSPTRSSCGLAVEHSQFVIHRICSSRTQVMCGLFLGWSQISEDPIYGGYLQVVRVKVLFHFWIWSFRLRKQAVNIGVVYSKAEFVIQALTHGWIPCKQTAFAFPSQSQWTIYTLNEPKPCSKTSRCQFCGEMHFLFHCGKLVFLGKKVWGGYCQFSKLTMIPKKALENKGICLPLIMANNVWLGDNDKECYHLLPFLEKRHKKGEKELKILSKKMSEHVPSSVKSNCFPS